MLSPGSRENELECSPQAVRGMRECGTALCRPGVSVTGSSVTAAQMKDAYVRRPRHAQNGMARQPGQYAAALLS